MSKLNPKKKNLSLMKVPLIDRINNIDHQLISQISIITPERIRGMEFRQQLKNFRFSRVEKQKLSMFGSAEEELLREQQNLTLTFLEVMKEFRKSQKNKFYLVIKKNDCVYYFFHDT